MSHKNDDLTSMASPVLRQAPIQEDLRVAAIANLEFMHAAGQLAPVEGWDQGTPLDAYLDILGLNGRSMLDNWRGAKYSGKTPAFPRPRKS